MAAKKAASKPIRKPTAAELAAEVKARKVKKAARAAAKSQMLEGGEPVSLDPAPRKRQQASTPKLAPANDPRPFLRVRIEEADRDRLKVIAAERRITIQDLMTQALNSWLSARHYPKLEGQDTDE